ncbi:MAG: hypothetical protein K6G15_05635, partial [Desulfovibrio sp.]|nr:hypothetical protein [Desulfovibrio sp.]
SPTIPMAECLTCLRCVAACPHHAASIRFVWQKKRSPHGDLPCPEAKEDASGTVAKEGGA